MQKERVNFKKNRIKVTVFGRKWGMVRITENWRTYEQPKVEVATPS